MRWVSSHLGLFTIFCIAFLFNNANAQRTYCSGTQVLSALAGNITDHTGTPNYNNEMTCIWVIKPSSNTTITSITLSFQKFDLEYSYDYLLIYNCECVDSVSQYTWFTGSTVPQDVIVPGNVVTVAFVSDEYVTGEGFSLSYYANNCPGGCSGRGTCHVDHCDCYPGYTGYDCSQTYCSNNCSYPFGECNLATNSCVCDFGYYGGDCANPYCFGSSNITDSSGSFTDHRGYGDYLNNMNCQWVIQPNPPRQSITLSFTYFDTEGGYDFITIYDGTTTSAPLIGRFSGSNIPPRAIATSGAMLVVWSSDVGLTRSGFDASFTSTDCPDGCSGQGDCIDGDCHCDVGFAGLNCSQLACTDGCFGRGVCEDYGNGSQACNCTNTLFVGGNCGSCVLEDSTCPIEYCYPYFHMHNITGGVISDKISGAGNYMPGQDCVWTVDPVAYNPDVPISGLALNFTQLELELNQARVYIYRGPSALNEADLIGLYTGEELPPTLNLDDTQLTVKFSSSGSNIVRQGFSITWSITYCPTNCNGNGVCGLGNICECYPGWDGPACNQTVCVGTCNAPNGQCLNSKCVCEPGWYSPSCSSTYCSGTTVLDGDYGLVKDHAEGDTYRPNSDCEFKIQHQNASETYSIVWTKFDLDAALGDTTDYVNLYNGAQASGSPIVLNGKTGSFLPHPFRSSNNSLYLQFVSGEQVNFPGFVAVYTANSKCPAGCSKSGYCYNGTCLCDHGRTGADCSQNAPSTKISNNHPANDIVNSFQWKYYAYKVPDNTDYLSVQSYQTSSQGNAEFFYKAEGFPGLYDYDFVIGLGNTNIFTIKNPPEGDIIYIGVYENSLDYSNFTITISSEQNEVPPNYRAAAIALAVIVFALFGVAGVCVFFLWKKTRTLKQEQRAAQAENPDSHEMGSVSLQQQQGPGYARFEDE